MLMWRMVLFNVICSKSISSMLVVACHCDPNTRLTTLGTPHGHAPLTTSTGYLGTLDMSLPPRGTAGSLM